MGIRKRTKAILCGTSIRETSMQVSDEMDRLHSENLQRDALYNLIRTSIIKARACEYGIRNKYIFSYSTILEKVAQYVDVSPIIKFVEERGRAFEYIMCDEINNKMDLNNPELKILADSTSLPSDVFLKRINEYLEEIFVNAQEKSLACFIEAIKETNSFIEHHIQKYIQDVNKQLYEFQDARTSLSSLKKEIDAELSKFVFPLNTSHNIEFKKECDKRNADISKLETEMSKRIEELETERTYLYELKNSLKGIGKEVIV